MVVQTRLVTLEAFERFVALPENADRNFEYIAGEIVEVVSNNYASHLAAKLLGRVGIHVDDHRLGRVTGADGGYSVGGNKYIPDGAFISFDRQPDVCREAYNPLPPDLAIEVLSPGNDAAEIARKISHYLAVGTVVWVVDPEKRTVDVYVPGQAVQTLREQDVLTGGELLPGFRYPLANFWD
ncbi:MAG: Uma2 family endonuclease [Anaerolineae bacterium]|nr:Uma2 family endonuclease [Anaerolineae bacterium]